MDVSAALSETREERAPMTGKLFFDRAEREQLDRTRIKRKPLTREVELPAPSRPPVINGFVKPSGATMTVWLDERMLTNVHGLTPEQLEPMSVGASSSAYRQQPRIKERAALINHRAHESRRTKVGRPSATRGKGRS